MSLHKFAEQVAAQGRGDDSLLVHMTPEEVRNLQKFAEANGTTLTINPTTGLPEAGLLSDLFKAVAPIALGAFLGPGAFGIAGLGMSAGMAGAAVGGLTTLATGSLSRGLMAGLGAYGGAGLAEGLATAGTGAGLSEALAGSSTGNLGQAFGDVAAAEGSSGQAFNEFLKSNANPATMSGSEIASTGFKAAAADPMQFAKDNFKYLGAAAAPIMADMMTPTTTKMPDLGNTGYIRQKVYDPYTQTYRSMAPVKANEWKDRQFSDIYKGASGGIVALAHGGRIPQMAIGGDTKAALEQAYAANDVTKMNDIIAQNKITAGDVGSTWQGFDTSGIAGLKLYAPPTQYTNEQIGSYLAANPNVDIQQAIKEHNADPAAVNAYVASLRDPFIEATDTTGGSGTTGIYNQMKAQGIDPNELYSAATAITPDYAGWSQEAITKSYNLQADADKLRSTLGDATSDKDWANLMDTGNYSVNDVAQAFGLSKNEVQSRYNTVKQNDAAAAAAAAAKKKAEDDAAAAAAAAAAKKKAEDDAAAAAAAAAAKKKAEEEAAALAAIAAAKKKAEEDAAIAAAKKKAEEEAAALAAIAAAKKKAEEDAAAKRTTCPAPEMRILLASGELKAAGELQVGDVVRTQHEHTLEWGDYPVTHVSVVPNAARLKFKFDSVDFVCSLDHKFFKAADKWVDAKDVCVGDMISGQTVRGIEQAEVGDVIRITIDDAHTYICEGLLSHNKSPTLTPEEIAAAAKAAADKAAADKAAADKAAADKAAADKIIAEAAAAKLAAEQAAAAAAKAAADKAIADGKTAAETAAAAAAAKLAAEKALAEKAAAEKAAADKAAADAAAAANTVTTAGTVNLGTNTNVSQDKTDTTSTGSNTLATTTPGAIKSNVTTDGTYTGTSGTPATVGTQVGQGKITGVGTETTTGTTGPVIDYGGASAFSTTPLTLAKTQLAEQAAATTAAQNKQLDLYRGFVTQNPNATDLEHANFLDKINLSPDIASKATPLSAQQMKNRYYDAKYNKMTGDSQSAYNFLMGKGAYPTKSGVGEIMRPYSEATLGMPASTNRKYIFDPATKSYRLNQDFVGSYRDSTGAVNYTMSPKEIADYFRANQGQADSTTYDWAIENGLTPEDIAASTGVPLSTVAAKWRDAKAKKDAAAKTAAGNIKTPQESIEAATGGLMKLAMGGMPSYAVGGGLGSLGSYSDGGRLLKGPGDGVSDSIPATIGAKQQPARLADGEFVIPARIVSELGNGSTDAGAKKLYAMMDRVQRARGKTTGKNKVAANSRADKYLPA